MNTKKDVPIKIGDKTYSLRYNFNALTTVEDATGLPFFNSVQELAQGKMTALRLILFAGLKNFLPNLTLTEVGEILDEAEDLKALLTTILEAVNNYFVKNKPADDQKKVPTDSLTPTEQ